MKHLTRTHAQALLDERGPVATDDQPVHDFLAAMRREYAATRAPAPRPALVARLDGHRPLHALPDPLAPPSGCLDRPRRGARPIAAALVGGTVLLGGLAGAGALPAPVQRTTADLGRHVGLELPRPESATPAPKVHADAHVKVSSPSAHDPATSVPSAVAASGTVAAAGPAGATGVTVTVPPSTIPAAPTPTVPGVLPLPVPSLGPAPPAPPASPLTLGTGDRPVRRVLHDVSHRLSSP